MANPILVSSGVTVTAASVVPAIQWALNGFHGSVPESVASLLAGLLVAAVHSGITWFNNRNSQVAQPTQPTQTPPAA